MIQDIIDTGLVQWGASKEEAKVISGGDEPWTRRVIGVGEGGDKGGEAGSDKEGEKESEKEGDTGGGGKKGGAGSKDEPRQPPTTQEG